MRTTGSPIAWVALFLLAGCGGGGSDPAPVSPPATPTEPVYTAFQNPEPVEVLGYTGDVEEPFISRDGMYLFFNSGAPDKNLHWATRMTDTQFQYQGAFDTVNTPAVEGTPTMDVANNFYFVSTANYAPPGSWDTLYSARFDGQSLSSVTPVAGLAVRQPNQVNFDIEVSADGNTLYFNDGDFTSGNNFPDAANIAIAVNTGGGFARSPNSDAWMANINTAMLEYAPAISQDERELFFTRLDPATLETAIYRATRPDNQSPFGTPERVSAISGFVEGPTLSPDERSLYYHRRDPVTGVFQLFRVTRP
jgi:hypothetical protein